eukprot:EG_transcript_55041
MAESQPPCSEGSQPWPQPGDATVMSSSQPAAAPSATPASADVAAVVAVGHQPRELTFPFGEDANRADEDDDGDEDEDEEGEGRENVEVGRFPFHVLRAPGL